MRVHVRIPSGWLVGIDQYYMERVQYILDTVIKELVENPDRQFMFVEQVRAHYAPRVFSY